MPETDFILLLIAVAGLAGFVDAIAGGGGLLTLPVLFLAGVDPVTALATNKLNSSLGTSSAVYVFAKKRMIDWRTAWPMALAALIAAMIGTLVTKHLSRTVLEALVPIMLIVIALYFGLRRGLNDQDSKARVSTKTFTFTGPVVVGGYDGLFGPGAGAFYTVSFVTLLGYGIIKATAHTKLLNLASNIGSLTVFAIGGYVLWPLGILMGLSALVGAQIGSRLAIRSGVRLIKPLLVTICCLLALRLLLDEQNPIRVFIATLL